MTDRIQPCVCGGTLYDPCEPWHDKEQRQRILADVVRTHNCTKRHQAWRATRHVG